MYIHIVCRTVSVLTHLARSQLANYPTSQLDGELDPVPKMPGSLGLIKIFLHEHDGFMKMSMWYLHILTNTRMLASLVMPVNLSKNKISTLCGCFQKRGTPKWMMYFMVPNPMNKWMLWGVTKPLFLVQHPCTSRGPTDPWQRWLCLCPVHPNQPTSQDSPGTVKNGHRLKRPGKALPKKKTNSTVDGRNLANHLVWKKKRRK